MKRRANNRFNGARGGRFTENRGARTALDEIQRLRLAGIRAGTWPSHAFDDWRDVAEEAHVRIEHGEPLTWRDRTALEIVDAIEQAEEAANAQG